MSKKEYKQQAEEILSTVGGKENVSSVVHCATRLRFKLKDEKKADKNATSDVTGVIQTVESGGQYQVVIGNTVADVYDQLIQLVDTDNDNDENDTEKGSLFNRAIDLISGIFTPVLPALIGGGMLKGLLMLAVQFGLSEKGGTYQILFAAADSVFYFLPFLLAATSAKKFKANMYLAFAVAGALVYPNMVELFNKGTDVMNFIGIPVISAKYASSVLPIIFAIYFMSKIEHFCNDHFHPAIKNVLTPLLAISITVPITYLVIGPIVTGLGNMLGQGYTALYDLSPIVCGLIFGGAWQALVVFGVHWGIVPLMYNNISLYGRDTISSLSGQSNFAQAGAAFGVFLKTKKREVKEIALPAAITGLFSITEPSIYGVNLKYKKPFYIACGVSAISGAIVGGANSASIAPGPVGVLNIPVFVGKGFVAFLIAIAISFFLTTILVYLFGYNDDMIENKEEDIQKEKKTSNETIYAPVKGKSFALTDVNDPVFSSLGLGEGVAITPSEGKIYAPVTGIVRVAYETGHALGIASENGSELLIHIGINTVELKGKYFDSHVAQGMKVQRGDLLVDFDLKSIEQEGYDTTVMMIVTNTNEFDEVLPSKYGNSNNEREAIRTITN
ncbi:beta-glucoside-specific PTS transporter subunit IIABC [Ligilactobacillus pobuzihii]|uniref:PTS system sucrose-specific EIIBCA component n=1 Tax=Ligilactobacillus pobuzihii TaxID=449659 RepID=A0A0R2LN79_9LACO|nr:beta-glucoside-specific PTS transporter subunit IIABC [Ligilactobacillus pobuzihii]KRK08938.1 sugar-specific permease [Ligilactobacillus pobuzihii E100301 = KCTC 13174]KRN99812.1 sugar-specific permease [Ligilactobacillus pobuzihii]GEN49230.1 PTS beta-glucoside transporter subunit EIIBCA [Ligilactobacillus pobuzihii]